MYLLDSPFLANATGVKSAGSLSIIYNKEDNKIELIWAHNTLTMCLGYMSSDSSPKSIFSKLPNGQTGDVLVQSIPIPIVVNSPFINLD